MNALLLDLSKSKRDQLHVTESLDLRRPFSTLIILLVHWFQISNNGCCLADFSWVLTLPYTVFFAATIRSIQYKDECIYMPCIYQVHIWTFSSCLFPCRVSEVFLEDINHFWSLCPELKWSVSNHREFVFLITWKDTCGLIVVFFLHNEDKCRSGWLNPGPSLGLSGVDFPKARDLAPEILCIFHPDLCLAKA